MLFMSFSKICRTKLKEVELMFADDTTFASSEDAKVKIISYVEDMFKWLSTNKLTNNTDKCEAMSFGSKMKFSEVQLTCNTIPYN